VGYNNYGDISASYSTCTVSATFSGNQGVGGLVGVTAGSITTSYSTGEVSGQRSVGGLVGWNYQSNITNSYSTGTVSGDQNIGGLVGKRDQDGGIVADCFWDTQTSDQTTSAGGEGKTTGQMQTTSTFLDCGRKRERCRRHLVDSRRPGLSAIVVGNRGQLTIDY